MSTTENQTVRSIEDTVRSAMNSNGAGGYYDTYAGPVVANLVAREQTIAEKLVGYAEANGADTEEVTAMLADLGMSLKAPEPEVAEPTTEDGSESGAMGRIEQMLTSLTGRIDSLTEFARRNGYRS